ncbi:unnamed protein product [Vitrella brassicaformis CCMP3155]|uniref:Uncharacterized protein n=1 Tax=Vitrella brassicaformis (strain CCMP3155) TaxID=1169540 RepID=A0A0G4EDZ3_VITBC|nr:unnamed protein product [Vitrella brassicaformis CCMP3155]|eukprot:CEL93548.1 unnamed protein product [Vitrella brassicaformis CCMP3155]
MKHMTLVRHLEGTVEALKLMIASRNSLKEEKDSLLMQLRETSRTLLQSTSHVEELQGEIDRLAMQLQTAETRVIALREQCALHHQCHVRPPPLMRMGAFEQLYRHHPPMTDRSPSRQTSPRMLAAEGPSSAVPGRG